MACPTVVGNIGGIIKTVLTMTGVLGGQAAATGTATAAQTGLNAAMTANPIGAVILAIEALIAVGVLLYKNWDTIKAAAQNLWNKFKDVSIRIGMAFPVRSTRSKTPLRQHWNG